ncbi:MAG TPA: glycoside hydrolase family 3 N-terminal domain-containing protein [Terracidiphilus sp.]|nr:glycoside hydrolase family 3 N-terminal domain-containing protein [Terracidiphilus sp.]
MTASLRRAAGSLLVVGLGGTELTGLERAWLRVVRPAGIILFRRNIAAAEQTRALLDEATGLSGTHSLRCVDVEGGTVDRLRDALAPLPSAQAVARADQYSTLSQKTRKDGAPRLGEGVTTQIPMSQKRDMGHPVPVDGARGFPRLAREHGELVARAVKAFGFNTTLAPVLDLGLPESSQVMGTRIAAATVTGVVAYARGFLNGLAAQGVIGCGKHFPGLGGGTRDSHLETPAIRRDGRELWLEDLAPYRDLRNELPMVMVNHAAYPETPGKARPASVSPYWITTVLRKKIGYRGIVFSDDLEMGGILRYMPIEEAAVSAVRAGMDLMEICHSPELILRAYEALIAEAERSRGFAELITTRARRTEKLRAKLFAGGIGRALTQRQFEALRTRVLRFSEMTARSQAVAEAPIA